MAKQRRHIIRHKHPPNPGSSTLKQNELSWLGKMTNRKLNIWSSNGVAYYAFTRLNQILGLHQGENEHKQKQGKMEKNKWVKQYTMIIACCWQKFRNQNWRYGLWNNHFGLNTFTGFFSYFFRDHPNFLGISGTFSGVSTISGVFQGFQESLATLGTVKKFRTRLCYTCDNPRHYIKRPGKCLLSIKLISGWYGLFQEDRCW